MTRTRRLTVQIVLCVVSAQLATAKHPEPRPRDESVQSSAGRLLPDEVRNRLVTILSPYHNEPPELQDERALDLLQREFRRSPSLFTLLDYGLILEASRPRPPRGSNKPPTPWSDPAFIAMRRQLERYTVSRPLPLDSLPLRNWWPEVDVARPVIVGDSKRKAAFLSTAAPSLFESDVDVFAFSGVPHISRQRQRLGAGGGYQYESPFETAVQFPSAAPLLANLAPLVEMFKVEGAGTLEIAFGKPQETQMVTEERSALVDTGSATLVGADGRWPVYAITHSGVIKGTLTRVVSNGTQCGGDEFNAVTSFDRPLPKSTYAILLVRSPLDPAKARIITVRELTWFARPSYEWGFWYADLEGDGRHDIAVRVGGVSDQNREEYFSSAIYANVNGRWKLLVQPEVTSCT